MKLYHDRLNETWLCEQTEQYFTTHISLPESFRHFSFEIKISRSWKKNSSYKPALRVFIYFSFSWELRATSIESQESEESYVAFLDTSQDIVWLLIHSFISLFDSSGFSSVSLVFRLVRLLSANPWLSDLSWRVSFLPGLSLKWTALCDHAPLLRPGFSL